MIKTITKLRAITERNVLKVLEGDCETAVGVHSKLLIMKNILKSRIFFFRWTSKVL